MIKFSIEDDVHAEWQGDYASLDDALSELQRRSNLSWDEKPNVCPCTGWKTCERLYTITEYDTSDTTWTPLSEHEVLTISHKVVLWHEGFEKYGN